MPGKHRTLPPISTQDEERFWKKVNKSPGQGPQGNCWTWTAFVDRRGYGQMWLKPVRVLVHRISFFLNSGVDPGQLEVCHHCDNPPCVNPHHLFIGNRFSNMGDASEKGRMHNGILDGMHKLTEQEIAIIRSAVGCQRVIAEQFGINQSTVSRIKHRLRWKHLP